MRTPQGKGEEKLPGVQTVPDKGTRPNPDPSPRGTYESVQRFNVSPAKNRGPGLFMPKEVGALDHNAGAPASPSRGTWTHAPYRPKD